MKPKNLLFTATLFSIFFFWMSCEDVIYIDGELDLKITENDSTAQLSVDTISGLLTDSIVDPEWPDSIPQPDTMISPDPNGENCTSVSYTWICGLEPEDAHMLNYDILPGKWRLVQEQYYPEDGEHTDEYFEDDYGFYLDLNEDSTFEEIFQDEVLQSGIWETHIEFNNQLWLIDSEGEKTVYYIISLYDVDIYNEYKGLQIATLEVENVAIRDRRFNR